MGLETRVKVYAVPATGAGDAPPAAPQQGDGDRASPAAELGSEQSGGIWFVSRGVHGSVQRLPGAETVRFPQLAPLLQPGDRPAVPGPATESSPPPINDTVRMPADWLELVHGARESPGPEVAARKTQRLGSGWVTARSATAPAVQRGVDASSSVAIAPRPVVEGEPSARPEPVPERGAAAPVPTAEGPRPGRLRPAQWWRPAGEEAAPGQGSGLTARLPLQRRRPRPAALRWHSAFDTLDAAIMSPRAPVWISLSAVCLSLLFYLMLR
jgi:hypothetical protein